MSLLHEFMELVQSPDVPALVVLIVILRTVGTWWATNVERLRLLAARLAYAVFLAYGLMQVAYEGMADPFRLCGIALRALLAAGVAHGFAVILLAPIYRVCDQIADVSRNWVGRHQARAIQHQESLRQREEREKELRQQREWEALAPERQQHQLEQDQKSQAEAEHRARDRHRREEARLSCVLLRDQYSTELGQRFTRKRLEEYFATYMTDTHAPEEVEARAIQLRGMIEQALANTGATHKKRFRSLLEIAEHFQALREDAEKSHYEPDIVDSILARYQAQENKAVEEFFKS